MTSTYLAIDLGAESGRAILGHYEGERLQLSELHRFPNVPVTVPGDGLHWDVLRLWHEITTAIRLAAREHPQLAGLGLDTWGVDFGLLDRRGRLIANPYHYRDSRTDGMMAEAFRRMPREQIYERTGVQFMQINTLYQLLSMTVAQHPALDIAETFLTIPDLFNYWLTGRKACEFTIATTTQCYDPRARDWCGSLLAAMGLPRRLFPELVPPGTMLGLLRDELAEAVGAEALPVVAPACHDTGSAAIAVPAEGEGHAWISSGTWSIIGVDVPEAIITPQSFAFNLTNEGGLNGSFRCSKNVTGLWLVQECRHNWVAEGHHWSYAELMQFATDASPLVSLADPDASDFLKPGGMPARIRSYCARTGQPAPETPGAIVRCALESVALKYRWVLEKLEAVTGRRLEPIHIIGGGTQNKLLNQFTAEATGRTVIAGPVEATAIGNILVQALALGHIRSVAEARAIVRRSFTSQVYLPRSRANWDVAYERLLKLIP